MPRVEAICISPDKGQPKAAVDSAVLRADHGIESDAHAGPWHRQVSLLAAEDIETVRRKGLPDLQPGAFAENLVLSGLDLGSLGLGSTIRLADAVEVTVTQIGKTCHNPCQIFRLTGDCIMPRLGLFARVVTGGVVSPGDAAEVLSLVPRETFQVVVLTISDRCSHGEARDTAGPAVADVLQRELGAHIYRTEILPDQQPLIEQRLKHYCHGHSIDLLVTVGGTGFSPRDVTPEATRAVIERPSPGIDEAMRSASLAKTPHAALSRGYSGIRAATLILSLPGSKRAALENLAAILPALSHGLLKLRGGGGDCGRSPGETVT
ncbi:MAG: MOSC domain-containing protein [Anaerolineaceae bacterium]|nr:MOSC domain-containing protein [Anaerolineaceae bacterium]